MAVNIPKAGKEKATSFEMKKKKKKKKKTHGWSKGIWG
jgi:hypothetical protein